MTSDPDSGPGAAAERRRLDATVRGQLAISQQRARDLCAIGMVAVDGVRAVGSTRIAPGATIASYTADVELSLQLGLPVVHRDAAVLVLHKPPHLAVHTGPLVDDCVADRLQQYLPDAGLAQRLDRPASGLLLCGEDRAALSALGRAMEDGAIDRTYLAVACGVVDGDRRTIDVPLLVTDEPRGDRPKVLADAAGQPSVTHLEVVARARTATLVRLRLETGRTHQIRAHLRAIGHPLLGDERYGDPAQNAAAHRTHGIDRAMLHCEQLTFSAPGKDERTAVRAFHEPDFARLFPTACRQPR